MMAAMMSAESGGILPSGYTQLEYVSNATTKIVTEIELVGSTWEVDVEMEASPSGTQIIICSDSSAAHWFGVGSSGYFTVGGGVNFGQVTTRTTYEVSFASTSISVTANGETKNRYSGSGPLETYVSLFGYTFQYQYKGKCYGIKCTNGGNFNGIPAKRNSDNHQGIYDLSGDVFYDLS